MGFQSLALPVVLGGDKKYQVYADQLEIFEENDYPIPAHSVAYSNLVITDLRKKGPQMSLYPKLSMVL